MIHDRVLLGARNRCGMLATRPWERGPSGKNARHASIRPTGYLRFAKHSRTRPS